MSISAHEATASRDCATPGCPFEAAARSAHCREHLADAATRDAHPDGRSPTMTGTATALACKISGCDQPAEQQFGKFGRLCTTHRAEAGAGSPPGGGRQKTAISDGYAAKVRALVPAARSLDQARRRLEASDTSETLKAEFDEASRRAIGVPTAENLARLEQAVKALRRGAPARDRLVAQYQDAKRRFELALAGIARDLRA